MGRDRAKRDWSFGVFLMKGKQRGRVELHGRLPEDRGRGARRRKHSA